MASDRNRLVAGLLWAAALCSATSSEDASAKRFVYLIQTATPRPEARLLPNADRDVIYLCFKQDCNIGEVDPHDVQVWACCFSMERLVTS